MDDLAKMHIDVLGMKTEKYHNIGAGTQVPFKQQIDVAKKNLLEAVKNGVFLYNGNISDRKFLFDASETERFFSWKFKSFEDIVFDIATQYVELSLESAT